MHVTYVGTIYILYNMRMLLASFTGGGGGDLCWTFDRYYLKGTVSRGGNFCSGP
jgi:hypothetical protein